MKVTLFNITVIVILSVLAVGYWRSWYSVSSQSAPNGKQVDINVKIDAEKVKEDAEKLKQKLEPKEEAPAPNIPSNQHPIEGPLP
jgi:hypothetical protein